MNWEKSLSVPPRSEIFGHQVEEKREFFREKPPGIFQSPMIGSGYNFLGGGKGIFGLWPELNPCPKPGEGGENIPGVAPSQKTPTPTPGFQPRPERRKIQFEQEIN